MLLRNGSILRRDRNVYTRSKNTKERLIFPHIHLYSSKEGNDIKCSINTVIHYLQQSVNKKRLKANRKYGANVLYNSAECKHILRAQKI